METKSRDQHHHTKRHRSHAAAPIPVAPTKETSARILSEDRTTRRTKYTIFWPGREDELKVVPALDILKYVTMRHFRAFRIGVEAARYRERMVERKEEAARKYAEQTRLDAQKKVRESWGREQPDTADGDETDVESSSDSDIPCDLPPKGSVKKFKTRVVDRRQGKGFGQKSLKAKRVKNLKMKI